MIGTPIFDEKTAGNLEARIREKWKKQRVKAKSKRRRIHEFLGPRAVYWQETEDGDVSLRHFDATDQLRLDQYGPYLIGVYTPDVPDGQIKADVMALTWEEVVGEV
ncbi:hypothetical protein [Thiohalorhabdus sp.]|uniref:hypothetical protein n=1 Tax=Thiohalorhabdus sp. TaxID=3094134 RepID=UPI002FC2AE0F